MPFATHFPNDDQPPWHLSVLEFIGLVINCLWCTIKEYWCDLKDGIFETDAYRVPSKSQNPTVLDQVGPASTQC